MFSLHTTASVRRAALVLAAGTALWGYSTITAAGGAAQERIVAKEFSFTPKALVASSGQVRFQVTNSGAIEHSFVIDALKIKSGLIKPGQTVTFTATAKPGTYVVYCDVPGHRDIGMIAQLTVK